MAYTYSLNLVLSLMLLVLGVIVVVVGEYRKISACYVVGLLMALVALLWGVTAVISYRHASMEIVLWEEDDLDPEHVYEVTNEQVPFYPFQPGEEWTDRAFYLTWLLRDDQRELRPFALSRKLSGGARFTPERCATGLAVRQKAEPGS